MKFFLIIAGIVFLTCHGQDNQSKTSSNAVPQAQTMTQQNRTKQETRFFCNCKGCQGCNNCCMIVCCGPCVAIAAISIGIKSFMR